jgi:hypothetical protein
MFKRKIQVDYDKKQKVPIYKELTYEFFSKHIEYEYCFKYNNQLIDIAHYEKNGHVVYHISIDGLHQEFDSPERLIDEGRIDGKTIRDAWEELEN